MSEGFTVNHNNLIIKREPAAHRLAFIYDFSFLQHAHCFGIVEKVIVVHSRMICDRDFNDLFLLLGCTAQCAHNQ